MKTLEQIKRTAKKGDYATVATTIRKSEELVKKVINGDRSDLHNIQKVFSDLLEYREYLANREAKRRSRKNQRLVYE